MLIKLQPKSFFLFTAFLFSTALFSQGTKNYKVGMVGFYNLENFYDTLHQEGVQDEEMLPTSAKHYTGEVYKDKVSRLAEVLSLIGKDVTNDGLSMFGCAEIENQSVLDDLVANPKFSGRNYKIVHYDSPDLRGIDVALIYNPKYFKVLFSKPLNVPLIGEGGKPWKTRDVLWVYGEYDGEPLHVFVNHWPSRRGGEEASAPGRATAAGVSKAIIDSLMKINPETKVIVMGDLNDDPVSPSVTKVLGAKGAIKEVKPGGLYNPWVKYYKEGIGTLAYNDAWNLFDQIMVSHGFLDKKQSGFFFNKATIFRKEFMLSQTGQYKGYPLRTYDGNTYQHGYSDHLPTYITFLKETK